jgi:alcohol dehydrogenase class IV
VHAIAHQFGGRYHTPHGLANAIMLPLVLRYSLPAVTDRLALLAVRAKLGKESEGEDALAQKFLDAVVQLNRDLAIPTFLAALKKADIPQLAEAACREAHTGYPVPRYMTQAQCEELIRQVLPPQAAPEAAPSKAATARKPTAATRKPAPRAKKPA